MNNTFGENCSLHCICITNNTLTPEQSCDPHSGICNCLPTWGGERCNKDIDECEIGTHDCDTNTSSCRNAVGGFECVPKDAYTTTESHVSWTTEGYKNMTTEGDYNGGLFYCCLVDYIV